MFNKLCVIGVGLIGGSVARAAKRHGLCKTIAGYGREQDLPNLITAKSLGVINDYFTDLGEAVSNADLIIIATPVGAIESLFANLQPLWRDEAVYTDVGSTKGNVVKAAEAVFGRVPGNFVPAHPVAGAEQSGVTASQNDLFNGKRLIITPVDSTLDNSLEAVRRFWEVIGAQITIMAPDHHDAILAATSHLPHILAFALVDMLGHKDEQSEIFQYAAGGFRDFTRIASSDPNMWLDISMANKGEIIPLIEQLKTELTQVQNYLTIDDRQGLLDTFTYAGKARQRFLDLFEN